MKKDYNQMLIERSFYENEIVQRVADLERARAINREREKLVAKESELTALLSEVMKYQDDVKRLHEAVEKEDREFKNRRIKFIDGLITEALETIFPDDEYRASLTCDFYRKSEVVLTLFDKNDNEMIPDICSGKLQQYLISFAAVSGIAKGLGVQNLYVDEAFGVAAPEILGEIGKIIQQRVEEGMQILMIAQNPGVYQDLHRREIILTKNPATARVEIKSVTDY